MNHVSEFLDSNLFFSFLNKEDKKKIQPFITIRQYKKNDTIINQNENNKDLYIIVSGEVSIHQSVENDLEQPIIAQIGKDAVLGELSFISDKPRSSSATCSTDVTIIVIPKKIKVECLELYTRISAKIGEIIESRLRNTTNDLSSSLRSRIQLLKSYVTLYNMFIVMLAVITISILANRALIEIFTHVDLYSPKFSWPYLLLLSIPLCIAQYVMKYPFKKLGFSATSLKSKLILLLIISLLSLPMIAFSYYVKGKTGYEITQMIYLSFFKLSSFSYLWLCVAQEYVRCLFQVILNDLPYKKYPIQPIVFSSLIFSLMHVHLGLAAVGATFLAGVLFAIYYQLNKNFISMCLLHWFPGHLAFALAFL